MGVATNITAQCSFQREKKKKKQIWQLPISPSNFRLIEILINKMPNLKYIKDMSSAIEQMRENE